MVALRIQDLKEFTKKLFIGETFDKWMVREASVVTYNRFAIDGAVRRGYYSEEERQEQGIGEYSFWKIIRPFCFSLIKGKSLPDSFAIVFKLPPAQTARFLEAHGLSWKPEETGLYINVRYEDQALYCVSGLSVNQFTMDKSLEHEWDEAVKGFLKKEGIAAETG